jgi:hypothetical protein
MRQLRIFTFSQTMSRSNKTFCSGVHKVAVPTLLAIGLAACGGGSTDAGGTGTLRLALTDAPTCGYDTVFVTVEKVRVHASSSAADADSGWSEVVLPTPQRVDLLTLTNGTLLPLGQTALPAGKYNQMRLVLGTEPPPGSAPGTLANSIKPTGSMETELKTPSGQQSGLKMNIDIDVPAGKVADFAIDFDACKSFVKAGNSGQYLLKPVLSVIPILSDGGQRIVGYVDVASATAGAAVSVQKDGVVKRATTADATGRFVLYPVDVGSYDLVVNAKGRVIAVMTGVPVVETGYTYVSTETNRIAPASGTSRSLKVTPTASSAGADIKVQKMLTGGPTVEVASGTVDSVAGFATSLVAEAPLKAAYAASPASAAFTADSATPTGKYSVAAALNGGTPKSTVLDITAADATTLFTFP